MVLELTNENRPLYGEKGRMPILLRFAEDTARPAEEGITMPTPNGPTGNVWDYIDDE